MHTLPQLRKLEEKYRQELVVVGVHSPKFPAERLTETVRKAVLRHGVQHPVVNDRDRRIWQEYTVQAWPSVYLLDPQGRIIGRHEGEIPLSTFDSVLSAAIQEFDQTGKIDRSPLLVAEKAPVDKAGPLAFPGKVLADAASGRLFIADSGHHRLLVASLDGAVQQIIGSGQPGLEDGGPAEARFLYPQGMTLAREENALYVADTENHAIRRVDLTKGIVETVAGTGQQARSFFDGGPARSTDLSSPWDLAVVGNLVIIAMAGLHQLWALDLESQEVYPFAGEGPEGLQDGPRAQAWLAQPSAIVADGQRLYFADSETSSIRTVGADSGSQVRTLVGEGLFEFGDVDGIGPDARLQHPLGVAYKDGLVYVADTFNNKVKTVSPEIQAARTLLGSSEAGHRDGAGTEARFNEPGGLSVAGNFLYIADTNNHAIRVADLTTRAVTTLKLTGF